MKFSIKKGVLGMLTKLCDEAIVMGEVEDKFGVALLEVKGGVLTLFTQDILQSVLCSTKDVKITEEGKVQVDFDKFSKLAGQVGDLVEIEDAGEFCKVTSGSAVWKLRKRDFTITGIESTEEKAVNENTIRSETFRKVVNPLRQIIPVESEETAESVKMLALVGGRAFATDLARVMQTKIVPPVAGSIFFTRRVVDTVIRAIQVTGAPDFVVREFSASWEIVIGPAKIRAGKLPGVFPVEDIVAIMDEDSLKWFDVRTTDLKDGLRKAVVVSDFNEPKISILPSDGKLEIRAEDGVGNKGEVSVAASSESFQEMVMRAELLQGLIQNAEGERLRFLYKPAAYIRMVSENLEAILMTLEQKAQPKKKAPKKA